MLILTLALASAHAFSLDGHRLLTERSVKLAAEDDPAVARFESVLVAGSVVEDLDLVTKWGRYSHYYDPEHELEGMRRRTSRDRVVVLADELDHAIARGDDGDAWWIAGRLLHQVQDMASPPHVVPVPHNASDGFESYDVTTLKQATGERLIEPLSGLEAHEELALETRLEVESATWTGYWTGSPGHFGTYGTEGNSFGRSTDPDRQTAARALVSDRTEAAIAYGRAFLLDTSARLAGRRAPVLAELHAGAATQMSGTD